MSDYSICIFGEVLFDLFPGGERVLGGAPFNVAWHLQAFGADPLFISRVGDDAMGHEIQQRMSEWGMATGGLQFDSDYPTGEVVITLAAGEPSYDILAHRAYDHIHAVELPPLHPRLIYHGTLALRNPVSRQALKTLQAQGSGQLFLDVNLRPPWWQREMVLEWVSGAHWVKLNEHELVQLSGQRGELKAQARQFQQDHQLEGLVVTRGSDGAFALDQDGNGVEVAPPPSLEVVDTVGAGDAFTSVLIFGLLEGWSLQQTMERAQSFASRLVGQRGATVADPDFYQPLIKQWKQ